MTIKTSTDCPKSENSLCSQITSHATIITPLYSTFVFDSAIVGYFLLFQLITLILKENMKPLVTIIFQTLLAQLTSMYPCIHVFVTGSWLHKKFHTTKYVLCTLICTSLHPIVAFVVFA